MEDLGLKCGLEIHQQLEGLKLYCNCPTVIRDDEPHKSVSRNLRAVAGESGQIDVAAKEEHEKKKNFTYQYYINTNCLIELDESPPKEMNHEALQTCLQICKMLKSKTVDAIRVMRKTVVDGSNTSGFQRTALVGMNGKLKTKNGVIDIPSIIIEEDSARNIEERKDGVVWRLDRLGIPLLEITTEPQIHTPEQAKEVAEKIGLLIRSTGKAKRGLGTIRQDINVSITGGTRVEVKGAQDLKMIPTIVETEALRQKALLEIRDELKRKKAVPADVKDLTSTLRKSESKIIKSTIESDGKVIGAKFKNFSGIFGRETQPGKRFGTELSERGKAIAGVGGLFHSDELPKYGITQEEVDKIRKKLDCSVTDGFILVADEEDRAIKAIDAAIERAHQALVGVPGEVRKANQDGTTSYERPLPGAARMYPETDVPMKTITKKLLSSITIPELIEKKQERFEKMGLGTDLAKLVSRSVKAALFDEFVIKFKKVKASYLAEILLSSKKTVRKQFGIDIDPSEKDFGDLFTALNSGDISKDSVLDILKSNNPVSSMLSKFELMSDKDIEKEIKDIVKKNKDAPFGALMGMVMKSLKGKADGKKISVILKKLAK